MKGAEELWSKPPIRGFHVLAAHTTRPGSTSREMPPAMAILERSDPDGRSAHTQAAQMDLAVTAVVLTRAAG